MSKICKSCGAVVSDDAFFCTSCGAPCPAKEETVTVAADQASAPAETPIVVTVPETPVIPCTEEFRATAEAPEKKEASASVDESMKPVSTAAFFWLGVVFAMPFVGFVLSIILSFAPKKINLKHYARAVLIAKIIAGLFYVLLAIGIYMLVAPLEAILSEYGISSLGEALDLLRMFLPGL